MNPDFDPFQELGPVDLAKLRTEQADRAREERQMIVAAFSTDAGRKWLAAQRRRFIEARTYQPGDSFDMTAFREGRRSIFLEIEAALEAARNEDKGA